MQNEPAQKSDDKCASILERLVSELRRCPGGMTCSMAGEALWGRRGQGDLVVSRYARPAGKLLKKAISGGLVKEVVYSSGQRRFYAR